MAQIEYKTASDFFPRIPNRMRQIQHLKNAKWQTLDKPTNMEGYGIPAGAQYKVFETKNFGWVVFAPIEGYSGKRIFKY